MAALPREDVLREGCDGAGESDPGERSRFQRGTQHEEQDVRGDQRRLDAPRQPEDPLGRGIHPDADDDEDRECREQLEGARPDELEERQQERDRSKTGERQVREPVHRDTAEQREDAIPDRGESSEHRHFLR